MSFIRDAESKPNRHQDTSENLKEDSDIVLDEISKRIMNISNGTIEALQTIHDAKKSLCMKKYRLLKALEKRKPENRTSINITSSCHENLINVKDNSIFTTNNIDAIISVLTQKNNKAIEEACINIDLTTKDMEDQLNASMEAFKRAKCLMSMNKEMKHYLDKLLDRENE